MANSLRTTTDSPASRCIVSPRVDAALLLVPLVASLAALAFAARVPDPLPLPLFLLLVVAFDVANSELHIVEDANNNCVYDSGERKTLRPLEEGAILAPTSSGYSGSSVAAVSGSNLCSILGFPAIQFLRDGAASSDLEVYMTSSRGTTTDFRLVKVAMATGRADAFRYTGSLWTRMN